VILVPLCKRENHLMSLIAAKLVLSFGASCTKLLYGVIPSSEARSGLGHFSGKMHKELSWHNRVLLVFLFEGFVHHARSFLRGSIPGMNPLQPRNGGTC
jgi:hypothetical protein